MYSKEEILAEAQQLRQRIQNLDVVQHYQRVEQQIHQNAEIERKMHDLKQIQKQSVNFQNYGKHNAYTRSETEIQNIETHINALPIVEEFKTAQYDANTLLQMMVSTMADRLNDSADQLNKE